jgi:DNA-binding ferritin-like protein
MQQEILTKCMFIHAVVLQAMRAWFHAAHHVTKGTGFNGDHELYAEIYEAMQGYYDVVVEKSIGVAGANEVASPHKIMRDATSVVMTYPDPVNMTSLAIASAGHALVVKYCDFLKQINEMLEKCGCLTLGLDDFHAATANNIETFAYKLGQRVRSEIQD